MKISVLGCGRWGSFISWYLINHGHEVIEWGRDNSPSFLTLKNEGKNEYITLDKRIVLTDDLGSALDRSEIIILSISSQSLREFLTKIKNEYGFGDKTYVLCMKGLEEDTGKRLSEIAIDCGIDKNNVAVWLGPGHIQSFLAGHPNCMVIDGYNKDLVAKLADGFRSELIRFYYGDDIIGNEVGAAAKNVIGIAAGMLDGSGYSSLKGPLMARGAREISRLIKAMGGNELSAFGLCHLGDYETTLFSDYSNNRRYGINYIKGEKFDKLAEGVSTVKALKLLGEKYGVDLPITCGVYSIIYENACPKTVFKTIFSRSTRKEF